MSQPKPTQILPFLPPSGPKIAPDRRESIPLTEASDRLVERAIADAQSGRRDQALDLLDQALTISGRNVEALLWRGALSPAGVSLPFLERALALDPKNERAMAGIAWARQRLASPTPPTAQPAPPVAPQRTAAAPAVPVQPHPIHLPPRKAAQPAGIVASITRLLGVLVDRPMMGLVMAILVIGLLGTAAVARAQLNRSDFAAATPAPAAAGASAPLLSGVKTPTVAATSTKAAASGSVARSTAVATGAAATTAAATSSTTTTSAATTSAAATTMRIAPTPTPPLVISVAAFEEAWAASNWARVVPIGEGLMKRNASDQNLTRRMMSAYHTYSVQLIKNDQFAEAVALLDKALQIDANDVDVRDERKHAKLFLDGTTGLAEGDFDQAIYNLRLLYDMAPNYRNAKSRLIQAYNGYGKSLEQAGKPTDAYNSYKKAWQVDNANAEATAAMARLKDKAPDTVKAAAGKKIEVSLAKQQVTVWENGRMLWQFKASTGKAPYLTRTGTFEILNKMPHADSRALGWGMPYWMGIYQAGGTENGFHGIATLANGKELPISVLGRTATSGCVMLSNPDAITLYNWATIGTEVWIH